MSQRIKEPDLNGLSELPLRRKAGLQLCDPGRGSFNSLHNNLVEQSGIRKKEQGTLPFVSRAEENLWSII